MTHQEKIIKALREIELRIVKIEMNYEKGWDDEEKDFSRLLTITNNLIADIYADDAVVGHGTTGVD